MAPNDFFNGLLARTIHEDALQTQQLVSWRCLWDLDTGGDSDESSRMARSQRCRQGTRGSRRRPLAKSGVRLHELSGLDALAALVRVESILRLRLASWEAARGQAPSTAPNAACQAAPRVGLSLDGPRHPAHLPIRGLTGVADAHSRVERARPARDRGLRRGQQGPRRGLRGQGLRSRAHLDRGPGRRARRLRRGPGPRR